MIVVVKRDGKKEVPYSIEKIKKYDGNIVIYPGHGDKTTLQFEKDNNMYFGG